MKTIPLDEDAQLGRKHDYMHGNVCEICGIPVSDRHNRCKRHAQWRIKQEQDDADKMQRHHLVRGFVLGGLSPLEAVEQVRLILD